jgi:hypothetical protein
MTDMHGLALLALRVDQETLAVFADLINHLSEVASCSRGLALKERPRRARVKIGFSCYGRASSQPGL